MARTHILGFPRIGARRELKFALEAYWRGEIDDAALRRRRRASCARAHWAAAARRRARLRHRRRLRLLRPRAQSRRALLGALPRALRLRSRRALTLAQYFELARGNARAAGDGDDQVVRHQLPLPRAGARRRARASTAASSGCFDEVREAQRAGPAGQAGADRPAHLPVARQGARTPASTGLTLLPSARCPRTRSCSRACKRAGVEWVQIDEPVLVPRPARRVARRVRSALLASSRARGAEAAARHLLRQRCRTTRLRVRSCRWQACTSTSVRAPEQLDRRGATGCPRTRCCRSASSTAATSGAPISTRRSQRCGRCAQQLGERLWIAPSCSLLHVPVRLGGGDQARRRAEVLARLRRREARRARACSRAALDDGDGAVGDELAAADARAARRAAQLQRVVNALRAQARWPRSRGGDDRARQPVRRAQRRSSATRLALPPLPTTTIGSFPQTAEIRAGARRLQARRARARSATCETHARRDRSSRCASRKRSASTCWCTARPSATTWSSTSASSSRAIAFTANGWVQSYGSRCVKPPDHLRRRASRPKPMTVEWTALRADR